MKRSILTAHHVLSTLLFVMLSITPALADQVILDDLIVDGNGCFGMDCVNGENFDFDTMRLKENNLRINFQDTSSTSSFPSNDWRITINDSFNGGDSYFSIDDVNGGRKPFQISAGASSYSLFVDPTGQVGIGTDAPAEKFHVVGNALITGNLELGSSRDYKSDIRDVEIDEAVEALQELRPVKYFHEQKPEEEVLGFIAEEVPDLVATNSRRSIGNSDIVALLTRVVQAQQQTIEELTRRVEVLESK